MTEEAKKEEKEGVCKETGATIRTEPQSPDWEAWWFHRDCYWKMQEILYD